MPDQTPARRGRQIPWPAVVRFHKEIVKRAEEGFFSLDGRDDQSERWTSLDGLDPGESAAGPWALVPEVLHSRPFRLAVQQAQHETLYLGGPCFLGWKRTLNGKWLPEWRPMLYREVTLRSVAHEVHIVPDHGRWYLSPLLFSLLDRWEVQVDGNLDELAGELLETAAVYQDAEPSPLADRLFRALYSRIAGIQEELGKHLKPGTFQVQPSPWVLFAPSNNFSALTRHLMRDYERLDDLLSRNPRRLGGLRLLEDELPDVPARRDVEVLPLIPLNASQRRTVQRILEQHPLTVVSGPPGTGKSQVVVNLLLNAWAEGTTVLFVSNNNKAVDVVRERVERFESEFPLAVRAGSKQKQNIAEVLRRTLNMASLPVDARETDTAPLDVEEKRRQLTAKREKLLGRMKSELPQRISEAARTALQAYGTHRSTLGTLEARERQLLAKLREMGFRDRTPQATAGALTSTTAWLARIAHYRQLESDTLTLREQLVVQLNEQELRRNRAAEETGLEREDAGDWSWLASVPGPEIVGEWEDRLRTILSTPIDQRLEAVAWDPAYDQWASAEAAEDWAAEALALSSLVRETFGELALSLKEIGRIQAIHETERHRVVAAGMSPDLRMPLESVRDWFGAYAEVATMVPRWTNRLFWSRSARLGRRLRATETILRTHLPLELLTKIGPLDGSGRARLAPVLDVARSWLEAQLLWEGLQPMITDVETKIGRLRIRGGALRLHPLPVALQADEWIDTAKTVEERAAVATTASIHWQRRREKEAAEEELRMIAREWTRLARGIPIRESWSRFRGHALEGALQAVVDRPAPATLTALRAALYSGALAQLRDAWHRAAEHHHQCIRLNAKIETLPDLDAYLTAWCSERPTDALVLDTPPVAQWPDMDAANVVLQSVARWLAEWRTLRERERPDLEQRADTELRWAIEKLNQAIDQLPESKARRKLHEIHATLRSDPTREWPLTDLQRAFAAYHPDRIRAQIEGLEAELERLSFDDAKRRWLTRLRTDTQALRAVDALEKAITKNRGEIPLGSHADFLLALRLVPIWITTAQASQAVPLEPELFDIVVIDEASQCTLTNLLPLVFRGKTLAVIGDENQLPAIPTIQNSEELALAARFDVTEHLQVVGHARNDVYKAATESLPRRRADVIMLDEHFRSHPQIIGFSNRHVYQQRLELKKNPDWGQKLPVGSGVHSTHVRGTTRRGDNGRSWVNEPEAQEVLTLLQSLRNDEGRTLSVGIVTPFAAQKEFLRDRVDRLGLSAEVLVDTAFGFQGDERDVMIFSPVVAKGMSPGASRWVESPPNLVNVALTRAREALFVVGDLDYCLQQDGILRQLALYCRDIALLRATSPAELELFSWMMVKGWVPQVHPHIGDIEVDFLIKSVTGLRLAIEVDGKAHHERRSEEDRARDAYLTGQGYDVLRIQAREVLETPFEVIHQIGKRLTGSDDSR